MKLKKVGEHLTSSFSEWKEYVKDQKQYTMISKGVVNAIDNLKDKLHSLDDSFLGRKNLYHEIHKLRNQTDNIKENIKLFIKSKHIKK